MINGLSLFFHSLSLDLRLCEFVIFIVILVLAVRLLIIISAGFLIRRVSVCGRAKLITELERKLEAKHATRESNDSFYLLHINSMLFVCAWTINKRTHGEMLSDRAMLESEQSKR